MNKNTIYIIGIAALVIVVGAMVMFGQNNDNKTALHPEIILENVPYEVTLYKDPGQPQVGDTIDFVLEVKTNGQLRDIVTEGSVLTHATVVSEDTADIAFYHATDNLIQTSPGIYEFSHTFNRPSDYTIWIEMNDNTSRDHHGESSDYIGKINFPLSGKESFETDLVQASQESIADNYRLQIESSLAANEEGRITITAQNIDGTPAYFLEDFDHYYVIASPAHEFYKLDHPDLTISDESRVITKPIITTHSGNHAFWIRLFIADETGEFLEMIDTTFVVNVPAS